MRAKPLLLNILHDSRQDIPFKGVTGKIFRTKHLADAGLPQPTTTPAFQRPCPQIRTPDSRHRRLAPTVLVYFAGANRTRRKRTPPERKSPQFPKRYERRMPHPSKTTSCAWVGWFCNLHGPSTTVVDRRETELLPAFDSGMSWRGIDDVFASGTNAAGAQCRATRAIAMR